MRIKRFSARIVALVLIAVMAAGTLTGCMRELTEQQSAALVALQSAVTYYENTGSLKDYQELVALAAANRADGIGVNWNAIKLPDTPKAPILTLSSADQASPAGIGAGAAAGADNASKPDDTTSGSALSTPAAFTYIDVSPYPGAIISSIIKGEDYKAAAQSLRSGQNPETGAFTEANIGQHIWSMITLTAATGRDGYDYDKAAEYLLTYQRIDGGFGYAVDSTASDVNLTGIASIALAPYYDKHKKSDEMKALVGYFKENQTADGGYEGPDGENAVSIASAIWGLTALRQGLPETKEGSFTPVDALLAYQNEDGSFRMNLDGEHKADPNATKLATIALCDVLNNVNSFTLMSDDAESYRIENVSGPAITLNINYPQESGLDAISTPFTVEEGSSALDALILYGKLKAMNVSYSGRDDARRVQAINGVEEKAYGETSGWICQLNDQVSVPTPAAVTLKEGDSLSWNFVPNINETIIQ